MKTKPETRQKNPKKQKQTHSLFSMLQQHYPQGVGLWTLISLRSPVHCDDRNRWCPDPAGI